MAKLPLNLFIPRKFRKDKSTTQPDYGVDMRAIEMWAQALQAYVASLPTSSGLYASLTGPGQTVTPGDLTQAGGFTVFDSQETGSHGINMTTHNPQGVVIAAENADGHGTAGLTLTTQTFTSPSTVGIPASTIFINLAEIDVTIQSNTATPGPLTLLTSPQGGISLYSASGVPGWANSSYPGFAFSQNGHIYKNPGGGSNVWTQIA